MSEPTIRQEKPDMNLPEEEQQRELETIYMWNIAHNDPPYKDAYIGTYGELQWIMEQRHWLGSLMFDLPEGYERANLSHAGLASANLSGSTLVEINLSNSILNYAILSNAVLTGANLREAELREVDLTNTDLRGANLSGATLVGARFSEGNKLDGIVLGNYTKLADVHWNGANLVSIDWSSLTILGDELQARMELDKDGRKKDPYDRLEEWKAAVRAYRLLSIALRAQGMHEEADRYAYRTRVCQRSVYYWQARQEKKGTIMNRIQSTWHSFSQMCWSGLLDVIAGYGFRPSRSAGTYLLFVLCFALYYLIVGRKFVLELNPLQSLIFSVTSFHGRGFTPSGIIALDSPLLIGAAIESIVGLVLEITFIVTFIQRFFAR
jgi:hypothetical protein